MKLLTILALTSVSVCSVSSMFILDDGAEYRNYHETENYAPMQVRVRRSPQGPPPPLPISKAQTGVQRLRKQKPKFESDEVFRAPSFAEDRADLPASGSSYQPKTYKKGKVGPVYTFVKTDYDANFKWGVRHVAGKQHGR